MNKRKGICAFLLILVILASLTGCSSEPFQYTFRQDRNNIEKIEICSLDYYNGKTIEPLISLAEKDIDRILLDLSSLECRKLSGLDSPRGYGKIIICIHYLDGEIEVIGTTNIGWITSDGDWHLTMNVFRYPELKTLLLKYVASDILGAVSEDFLQ